MRALARRRGDRSGTLQEGMLRWRDSGWTNYSSIAYMQGLGRVADIIWVWGWAWVMLQRGLVCIIETSVQKASQPVNPAKHCFLEGKRYKQGSWMPAILGPCSTKRRKYRQKLLCWALGCCSVRFAFVVAGSCAARSLLFSRWFSGLLARARACATRATKRCYLRCFVAFAFAGWLAGCSFWAAHSGVCARGLGPGWGPESLHSPASSGAGVGNMHNLTNHIRTQDTFLIKKKKKR